MALPNFRNTISSVVGLLSYAVCVISLSRLIFEFASFDLSEVVSNIFAAYQAALHPPIVFVLNTILELDMQKIEIDILILYTAVGFSVRATALRLLRMNNDVIDYNRFRTLRTERLGMLLFSIFVTLTWPLYLFIILESPKIVLRYADTDGAYLQGCRSRAVERMLKSEKEGDVHTYIGDLRIWLAMLFAGIVAGVFAFALMNYVYSPFISLP